MSDIQDEAYSEAMDDLEAAIKEIGRLKSLLARAAEALKDQHGTWLVLHENCQVCRLIAELRKAAQ